ncbi:MAG TPA: LysR substrate-binding domain-containing protein [Burkholderiaceae bacterium]|nr:LysR substrate-binding domain-containing protein [Burkholderiaceae bacterium]
MNPKSIEAFRAVMLSGSMTIAARDIHTTQPNVSRLISHLEYDLDMKLFERTGNKLTPTDEAIAFLVEVERYYLGLKTLKDTAGNIKRFGSGRLRVATAPALGLGFIAGAVKRFSDVCPGVTLSIRTNSSATLEQLVASQLCDVALAVYASGGNSTAVNVEKLADIRGMCALPAGHRLAGQPFVHASDLKGESFVSLSHHDGMRERVDSVFHELHIPRRMLVETEFFATVCSMVIHGVGVSVVNPLVAKDFIEQGLVLKPLEPRIDFPVYLLSPGHRPASILAQRFLSVVREMLVEYQQQFMAKPVMRTD